MLGRASGNFGWKGMLEVLPNFLPPVNELLNYYHHLLHRLIGSIYRTHQILVSGPLRQWPTFGYLDLSEIEVLCRGEFLVGEIVTSLSTNILP